jgi:PAS domain S-box-containing protein
MTGADSAAFVVCDPRGVICYWSDALASLTGHGSEVATGALMDVFIPLEFREEHWLGFRSAWQDNFAHFVERSPDGSFDVPVLCGDGRSREMKLRISIARDTNNAAIAVVASFLPLESA